MKLNEKNGAVSCRIWILREGRNGNAKEILNLLGPSLDETRRLRIAFPRVRKPLHEPLADQTGRESASGKKEAYLSMRAFNSFPGLK